MSYYERWLNRLETHVVKYGFVTQEELKSGKAAAGSRTETSGVYAGDIRALVEPRNTVER